jgi:2-succinyl-5-enolpyruvyl-6-hydroxy-3-cyclohexene-1-carboxylate synthase
LVTGDLALFHDTNGLAAARRAGPPVVILVLNNDGGGIFSFLPIAEFSDVFEPFFAAPHGLTFEHAAALHGLVYAKASSPVEAEHLVKMAFAGGASSLIEVPCDRSRNLEEHRALSSRVAAAVDAEARWGS